MKILDYFREDQRCWVRSRLKGRRITNDLIRVKHSYRSILSIPLFRGFVKTLQIHLDDVISNPCHDGTRRSCLYVDRPKMSLESLMASRIDSVEFRCELFRRWKFIQLERDSIDNIFFVCSWELNKNWKDVTNNEKIRNKLRWLKWILTTNVIRTKQNNSAEILKSWNRAHTHSRSSSCLNILGWWTRATIRSTLNRS